MIRSITNNSVFRTNLLLVVIVVSAVLFSGTAQPAMAVPITFVVQGTVNHVDAPLAGTFSIGDTFRVVYTFESSTPDSSPTNPNRGDYLNAVTDLTATVGNYTATAFGSSHIAISDNNLYSDTYRIDIPNPMLGPSINGYDLSTQSPLMLLGDDTCMALTSDALPTSPADLAGFPAHGLSLEFSDPLAPPNQSILAFVTAHITSITPEPGSVSLLALGAVALLRRR